MKESRLAVILATDTYATIRPVVERLRRQTVRDQVELVLVAPSADAVSEGLAFRDQFAGIRIIEHPLTVWVPPAPRGSGRRPRRSSLSARRTLMPTRDLPKHC